jgi:peptidoglycan-associated lipoprotein
MQAQPVLAAKTETKALPAYLDPKSAISTQRSVYFDFDNFSVKPEFAKTLEMHGKYLASNPKVGIRVEGNADERGSAEYNLALGQKRADAVVRALKVYGVRDSQMESISFGREKPKAMGHEEAAWAQNRRVDLAYPGK